MPLQLVTKTLIALANLKPCLSRKLEKPIKHKMGKSSSIFSFCNIFKACFSSNSRDDTYSDDGGVYVRRRICPSDEDRGGWTAEPGIDGKATDFITRFYASHVSDPECQTFAV